MSTRPRSASWFVSLLAICAPASVCLPDAAPSTATLSSALIPDSHLGDWSGTNRLWLTDPDNPFRSEATIECRADGIDYTWAKGDTEHQGTIHLHGQPAALRLHIEDTFHAPAGMDLHGYTTDGVLRTYGTYEAGPGQPEWGWILELDWRNPEAFVMRMFNVVPGMGPVPAVVLSASRD